MKIPVKVDAHFKVEFGVDIESLRWEPGFRELEESTCSKLPSMHPSLLVELCKIFWQLDVSALKARGSIMFKLLKNSFASWLDA